MKRKMITFGIALCFSGAVLAHESISPQTPTLLQNFNENIQQLINDPAGRIYIITRSGYSSLTNRTEFTPFATPQMIASPLFSGMDAEGNFLLLSAKNTNENHSQVEVWLHNPVTKTTRLIYRQQKPHAFHNVSLAVTPNAYGLLVLIEDVPAKTKQRSDVAFISPSVGFEPVQFNNLDFVVRNAIVHPDNPHRILLQGERFGVNAGQSESVAQHVYLTEAGNGVGEQPAKVITSMPQQAVSYIDNLICGFNISTPLFSCGSFYPQPLAGMEAGPRWTQQLAGNGLLKYSAIVTGQGDHSPVVYGATATDLYALNAHTGQLLSEIHIPDENNAQFVKKMVSDPAGQRVYQMFITDDKEVGAISTTADASTFDTLFTLPVPQGEYGVTSPLVKDKSLYFGVGRGLYRYAVTTEAEDGAPVAVAGKNFTVKRNAGSRGYDLNGLASQHADDYHWSIVSGKGDFWLQVQDRGEWVSNVYQPTARALIPANKTGKVTYRLEVKNKQGETHHSDITVTVE